VCAKTVSNREAEMTSTQRRRRRPRRNRVMRAAWFASIIGGGGVLAAACGTGVVAPGVASVGTTATTTQASTPQGETNSSLYKEELKYVKCMRTHGAPTFPDPSASGGFVFPSGSRTSSSAMKEAQSRCQKFMPGGGFPGPGTTTHPTAAALSQMLKVSQCMRRHGITQFPDPTTSIPANRWGGERISDRDGVILVFPNSLDTQSPQFARAAADCNFAVTNH
jgi:hypothetical protein